MVRAVNISLIVALCCLGSAVAQRQRTSADQRHVGAPSGFGSADYRRLHLTPYHGRGYHGINHVYQGHGTNRVNGYFGGGFGGVGSLGSDPFLDEREIYPEWFEGDSADDCDDVPENVNTGRIRDVCGDDDLGTRFCICVKRRNAYGRNNYEPICGECRDPCSLRFVPDKFGPRRTDFNNNNGNNNPETKK